MNYERESACKRKKIQTRKMVNEKKEEEEGNKGFPNQIFSLIKILNRTKYIKI
jgi:hypothetical protein